MPRRKVTPAGAAAAAQQLKEQPPTAEQLGVQDAEPGARQYMSVVPEEERVVRDFMADGVRLEDLQVWDSTYIPPQLKDPHTYYRWVKFDPPGSTITYGKEAWWMSKGMRPVLLEEFKANAQQRRPEDWAHFWPQHWHKGPSGQVRMGDMYLYRCPMQVHLAYKRLVDSSKGDHGQALKERFHSEAERLSKTTGYGVDTWEIENHADARVNYQQRALKGDSAAGYGPKQVNRR